MISTLVFIAVGVGIGALLWRKKKRKEKIVTLKTWEGYKKPEGEDS